MPITTALNTLSSATTIASLDMEASGEAELPIEDPELNSYGGGIFAGAHHFTVAGGTFNNITKNYISTAEVPPDFRTIPLGDIDLQRQIRADEIRLDQSSGVISRQERGCVQRVYSKVEGRMSDTTVAVYEGDTAEEEWRRDIAKYYQSQLIRNFPMGQKTLFLSLSC
ncbi:hypothetical protein B0H16DRAFT_1550332 [Mycena metata]|uniref:Uncharacterized protein n=1 Tax=Mycena metata TaxID=1033252 RepID=A0AAD7N7P7_9AGAR|nr:hypothetical protein B0H16DRAFT_1550332 [Mycena metata]